MKILVFDSGVGGFSIVQEIARRKAPISLEYICDQANFPYGTKSDTWLAERLRQIAVWAKKREPDAFILACNTGTVAGITEMRKVLTCPVIGVEPVIKPLAVYDRALVIMTLTAAESDRTRELASQFGPHVHIYGCKNLAQAIENNDNVQVKKSLDEIKEIVDSEQIQAIGLSCTHYPLISDQFKKLFPAVHIYDPSSAVVNQVLRSVTPKLPADREQEILFQTTGEVIRFREQIRRYLGMQGLGEHIHI